MRTDVHGGKDPLPPVESGARERDHVGKWGLAEERGLVQEQGLPVLGPLLPLLPEGLRRGTTVAVTGSTSLALTVAAGPAAEGRWLAGVGWDRVGLLAAHELGVPWGRLVLVAAPAERPRWAAAMAALIGAFDVVVVRPTLRVSGTDARRLAARARDHGTVLLVAGGIWPGALDVELRVVGANWQGLDRGAGHLQARRMVVEASGRGRLARPRRVALWLPAPDGTVRTAEPLPSDGAGPETGARDGGAGVGASAGSTGEARRAVAS